MDVFICYAGNAGNDVLVRPLLNGGDWMVRKKMFLHPFLWIDLSNGAASEFGF